MRAKQVSDPYLNKSGIKRVALQALLTEHEKEEPLAVRPLRFSKDVYKDLIYATEGFLVKLVTHWEKHISTRPKKPKTMLARDVQDAFGILYSDAPGAELELKGSRESVDMEFLDRNLTTRSIRLSILRAACGAYAISNDAVHVVKLIVWGRFLALARRTFQAGQTRRSKIGSTWVRAALAARLALPWVSAQA